VKWIVGRKTMEEMLYYLITVALDKETQDGSSQPHLRKQVIPRDIRTGTRKSTCSSF
jgi:hypothetical protein